MAILKLIFAHAKSQIGSLFLTLWKLMTKYNQLIETLRPIHDLRNVSAIISWDQHTFMPPQGAVARAHQLATIDKIGHEKFTDKSVGKLLDQAEKELTAYDEESPERCMVRVIREEWERERKIPTAFAEKWSHTTSTAVETWAKAREKKDFRIFKSELALLVDMNRQRADYLNVSGHPYTALLQTFEPDLTTEEVEGHFNLLKEKIIPLAAAVKKQSAFDDDKIFKKPFCYDENVQLSLSQEILQRMGFQLNKGRVDRSLHPFTTSFSIDDVRLTVRTDPHKMQEMLSATFHEGGHGLYEQNFNAGYERTFLARGASTSVHESQSRLWENLVGKSSEVLEFYFPIFQKHFPENLRSVSFDSFSRAVNKVSPSFIRVEADELTYNLHIFIRFEIERDLMDGKLSVDGIVEAWNEKTWNYLGIAVPNDAEGVLQDVHWAISNFGYFPTYGLGNILSVQYFNKARQQIPALSKQFKEGEFTPLLTWLIGQIYNHGTRFKPNTLLKKVTGENIDPTPYLNYLSKKYGEIYGI